MPTDQFSLNFTEIKIDYSPGETHVCSNNLWQIYHEASQKIGHCQLKAIYVQPSPYSFWRPYLDSSGNIIAILIGLLLPAVQKIHARSDLGSLDNLLQRGGVLSVSGITDGTSNTLMLAEKS